MKNRIYKFSSKWLILLVPILLLACDSKPSEADGWEYHTESESDFDVYNRVITYTKSDDLTKEYLKAYEGTWISTKNPEVAIIIENDEIEIGIHTDYETFPAKGFELESSEWAFEDDEYEPSTPVYSMGIEAPTHYSDQITTMTIFPLTLDSEIISSLDYGFIFIVDNGNDQILYYDMKKSEIKYNESSDSYSGLEEYKKNNILVEPAEIYNSSQIDNLTNQFFSIHEGVWEDPNFSEVLLAIDNEKIYLSYDGKNNIYPVNGFRFESFERGNETHYGNSIIMGPPTEYMNIISGLSLIPSNVNPERQAEPDYIFYLRVQGVNGSSISHSMQRTDYSLEHDTPSPSSNEEIGQDNSTTQSNEGYPRQQENKVYENNQTLEMEEINNKYSENQLNSFGIQSEPTHVESDDTFIIDFHMRDDIDFNDFKYTLSGEKVTPNYAGESGNGYNAYTVKGHFDWINQFTDYRSRFGDDYDYYIVLEIMSEDDMIVFEDYTDYIEN